MRQDNLWHDFPFRSPLINGAKKCDVFITDATNNNRPANNNNVVSLYIATNYWYLFYNMLLCLIQKSLLFNLTQTIHYKNPYIIA